MKLVDKGEGMKRVSAKFVALQPLYRLLVVAARDRPLPDDVVDRLLNDIKSNARHGKTPPPEPENDPTQLVVPESL